MFEGKNFIKAGLLVAVTGVPMMASADAGWSKSYDKDGIQVFTRQVEGSTYKEFRGETIVNEDLASVVSLFWSAEDMPKWMDGCKRAEVKEQVSDLERKLYLVNAAPGLLKDRDLVISNKVTQDPVSGTVRYTMDRIEYPIDTSNVHVPKMNGFVDLIPQGPKQTKLVYQAHLEAGGIVPGWAANIFVEQNPVNTLKGARSILKDKSYPDHPSIKNF